MSGTALPGEGRLPRLDEYSAAKAFVEGRLSVRGDLCAAIRYFCRQTPPLARQLWFSLAASVAQFAASLRNGRAAAARNIRFHYDRSNAFYRLFLDSRMLYSAARFRRAGCSLEEAQAEKLDDICRRLHLAPGERFLDVGCGWGALVVNAAERFGAHSTGCTLSLEQAEYSRSLVAAKALGERVSIATLDYRDLNGTFDKIASVGMFEHVGRRHLREYFRKIHSLLAQGGLFLNRGIVRPEKTANSPATLFLQRNVFPGGELAHLADVVREAERAGFETVEMEDLRHDYALTCRAWVDRLIHNAAACAALVGDTAYRTWLLYLAASAVCFEDGLTDCAQVTFEKRPIRERAAA